MNAIKAWVRDDTPEGIHDWLEWYGSLQPLIFTVEEREAWQKETEARKDWELSHADEREQKLRGVWE